MALRGLRADAGRSRLASGNAAAQGAAADHLRFVEKRNEDAPINIVAIKNIEKLSNEEMISFAKNIILKHKQSKYKWNYSARCFVFERNV